jgi:hypothetical protein
MRHSVSDNVQQRLILRRFARLAPTVFCTLTGKNGKPCLRHKTTEAATGLTRAEIEKLRAEP